MKQINITRKHIDIFYILLFLPLAFCTSANKFVCNKKVYSLSPEILCRYVIKADSCIYIYESQKILKWKFTYKRNGYWAYEKGIDALILSKCNKKDSTYYSMLPDFMVRVHIKNIGKNRYQSNIYTTGFDGERLRYAFIYDNNYNIKEIYELNVYSFKN